MSVLLKNSVIPNTVKTAPEERKMIPSLRLDPVSAVGRLGREDDFFLRRC